MIESKTIILQIITIILNVFYSIEKKYRLNNNLIFFFFFFLENRIGTYG